MLLVARQSPMPPLPQYVLHALQTLPGQACRMAANAMLVILVLSQQQIQRHTILGRVLQSRVLPTLQGRMCRLDAHILATLATIGPSSLRQLHRHITLDPALLSLALLTLRGQMCHLVAHAMRDTVGLLQPQPYHHSTHQHAQQSHVQLTLLGSMCRPDVHMQMHATLGSVGPSLQQLRRHTTITPEHVLQWHAQSTLRGLMYHLVAHAVLDAMGASQQQLSLRSTMDHALLLRAQQTVVVSTCHLTVDATLGTVGVL